MSFAKGSISVHAGQRIKMIYVSVSNVYSLVEFVRDNVGNYSMYGTNILLLFPGVNRHVVRHLTTGIIMNYTSKYWLFFRKKHEKCKIPFSY